MTDPTLPKELKARDQWRTFLMDIPNENVDKVLATRCATLHRPSKGKPYIRIFVVYCPRWIHGDVQHVQEDLGNGRRCWAFREHLRWS